MRFECMEEIWAGPLADIAGFKWDFQRRSLTCMNADVHIMINLWAAVYQKNTVLKNTQTK